MNSKKNYKFAFFGTDHRSVFVLEKFCSNKLIPELIVTVPNTKKDRKGNIIPNEVYEYAISKQIEVKTIDKFDDSVEEFFKNHNFDFFVTASYGKIVPYYILQIPKYGSLNIHPSLLPLYRGTSPIVSAILDDKKDTGVTVIIMDEKMDHGDIIFQSEYTFKEWPNRVEIEKILFELGADLIINDINDYISGVIIPKQQDHNKATFTKFINKEDGLIDVDNKNEARKNFLKYIAYRDWPSVHYFKKESGKEIRHKITEAEYKNGNFIVKKVIPEGKKEIFL